MDRKDIESYVIHAIRSLQTEQGEWVEISRVGTEIAHIPRQQKLLKFLEGYSNTISLTKIKGGYYARPIYEDHTGASVVPIFKSNADIENEAIAKINNLEPEIRRFLENPHGEAMRSFGVHLLKLLNDAEKCELYSIDVGYDYSTYAEGTGEKIELSDYDTVEDLLDEYTGSSRPTFISGYGMSAQTYHDAINEDAPAMIYEIIMRNFPLLSEPIIGDKNDLQHDIICDELNDRDLSERVVIDKFSTMKVEDLLAWYQFAANAELMQEEREKIRARDEYRAKKKEIEKSLELESAGSYEYIKSLCLLSMRMNNSLTFTKPMLENLKKQLEIDGKDINSKPIQASLRLLFGRHVIPSSNSVGAMFIFP